MDAKDHPVIAVLGDQRRFIVPIYQRQYKWGGERLGPFWEDVAAKAEEVMQGGPKFSHYMGALILAPGGDGFTIGATPRVQVVDGQQRLTTFQLFLVALRDVGGKLGITDLAGTINSYLYVPRLHADPATEPNFRLVPTPDDRPLFHLIVEKGLDGVRAAHQDWFFQNGVFKQGPERIAANALVLLSKRIEHYARFGLADDELPQPAADDSKDMQHHRLQALLTALLSHLKLVVITLSENDDAQVIFETLNSQAEPLLAMDLVRNNIFHRAAAQGEHVEKLFDQKWRPFDQEKDFWGAPSPRAKPKRPRIDHFLSHALTAQTGSETSLRELYAEYRAFARPKGKPRFGTVAEELDALVVHRPSYRALEGVGGDGALSWLGTKLNLWEVSTAYPLAFCIAASSAAPGEKGRLYKLVHSYLVRRALCGLTPKNLNKTFARLTKDMLDKGVSVETFAAAFASDRGETVRFPDDQEFRAGIYGKPAYTLIGRKERLADLLWDLECATRTKYAVHTPRPAELSVEHVMPQSWQSTWPLPDGRMAADLASGADEVMLAAVRTRSAVLDTLGNLTLVTVPGNSAASNKPFLDKKLWLQQSLLALNLAIVEREAWNEAVISERGKELAEMAVKIWSAPTEP